MTAVDSSCAGASQRRVLADCYPLVIDAGSDLDKVAAYLIEKSGG